MPNLKEKELNSLLRHRAEKRAIVLIEKGYRTKIIEIETGIPDSRIRTFRRGLSTTPAARGTTKESYSLVDSVEQQIDVTLFLLTYKRLGGDAVRSRIDIDAVSRSHKIYSQLRSRIGHPGEALDVNECWVLARDYRKPPNGIPAMVELRTCTDCDAPYAVVAHQHRRPGCPYCEIERAPGRYADNEDGDTDV